MLKAKKISIRFLLGLTLFAACATWLFTNWHWIADAAKYGENIDTSKVVFIQPYDHDSMIFRLGDQEYGTHDSEFVRNSKFVEGLPSNWDCLLYTSPSPRDATLSRMPSSA